jgi:hypothetical protein
MCNCGKKRNQITQQTNNIVKQTNSRQVLQSMPSTEKKPAVWFEYTGQTALSVIGSTTRKNYRFRFPGDTQLIDAGDATSMLAIPVLKKFS